MTLNLENTKEAAMPNTTDSALPVALDVFVDLMARQPRDRGYSPEVSALISDYAHKFRMTTTRIAVEIGRRRRALAEQAGGVCHQVPDPHPGVVGGGEAGAHEGGVPVPLAALRLADITLEVFDEIDVGLGDGISLRVRRQKQGDKVLQNADTAGQRFDFKPEFKIVVGRHDGVSSVALWRAYQAHLSGESQAGGAE